MEPTTNLPVNSNPEPKYISVTVTEIPGGYDTAAIYDPSATNRDRWRMVTAAVADLARMVAPLTKSGTADAVLSQITSDAAALIYSTEREDAILAPTEGSGDDEDA